MQVHLLESIAAYFYALQGRPEQAPELFQEHKLAEVSFFGPCRPMMSLIEQQVWLAQGEYVKVIAHSEGLLRRCEAMHYGLVGLQARIQLAAAQLRFGQRAEARAALAAALLDAVQDDFWVLFVEQYPALAPLLEGEDWAVCEPRLGPFVARILPAGRAFAARLGLPAPAPEWGSMLSSARVDMLRAPTLVLFPALAIVLTAFSVNLLGDGLRDAMDPRLKN